MIKIRLVAPFSYDHVTIPAGEVISISENHAERLTALGAAEYVEPRHAVTHATETREIMLPQSIPADMEYPDITIMDEASQPKRRGRPRKIKVEDVPQES